MRTSHAKWSHTGLSYVDRLRMVLERAGNKRLRSLGTALYRLTKGRITPRHRHVVLLTIRGRKSGREHTVLLQSFPDGPEDGSLVLVAANSGKPTQPDWFHNLKADPTARVEIMGRTVRVRAEQLPVGEAAALWPRILRHAPTYVLYRKATDRVIPLVRLVPLGSANEHRWEHNHEYSHENSHIGIHTGIHTGKTTPDCGGLTRSLLESGSSMAVAASDLCRARHSVR